jgi:hypothetical protein
LNLQLEGDVISKYTWLTPQIFSDLFLIWAQDKNVFYLEYKKNIFSNNIIYL